MVRHNRSTSTSQAPLGYVTRNLANSFHGSEPKRYTALFMSSKANSIISTDKDQTVIIALFSGLRATLTKVWKWRTLSKSRFTSFEFTTNQSSPYINLSQELDEKNKNWSLEREQQWWLGELWRIGNNKSCVILEKMKCLKRDGSWWKPN